MNSFKLFFSRNDCCSPYPGKVFIWGPECHLLSSGAKVTPVLQCPGRILLCSVALRELFIWKREVSWGGTKENVLEVWCSSSEAQGMLGSQESIWWWFHGTEAQAKLSSAALSFVKPLACPCKYSHGAVSYFFRDQTNIYWISGQQFNV